jgi:hypothetical protein
MTAHITKTWFEDGKLITQVFEEKDIYKREWVGLTDEEIDSYFENHGWSPSEDYYPVIKDIEAKLKEKNT